jgi:predicted AlkP superfamily pyrophosphatase or phosphodiesterase
LPISFEGRRESGDPTTRAPLRHRIGILFVLLLLGASSRQDPAGPTLVMLSLDGVRYDYPDRVRGGAFQRLEREGIRADRLIPSFPASTFPVHATLATGCYPERHGILNSRFVDSHRGVYDKESDPGWLACEPLWVNAERAQLPAAVLNWMGSFGKWGGVEATDHAKEFTPAGDRETLRKVLELLGRTPSRRPRLVMAYLAGADHVGHESGPDSPRIERRMQSLDGLLSSFLTGLEKLPGAKNINLMVVSDHGMAARRGWLDSQGVLARRHISGRTLASGGTANVYLSNRSDRGRAIKALSGLPELEVFQSGALPPDLHYEFPGRTGDLVLVASVGIELGRHPSGERKGGGVHGYRGTEEEMGGIFYGWGPAFRAGVRVGRINAVDVYSVACSVLGIRPSTRAQGTLPDGMLKPQRKEPSRNPGG